MIGHDTIMIDYALIMTKIISEDFDMFVILSTIIFVVVRERLTTNDLKSLRMTTNHYEKWNRS